MIEKKGYEASNNTLENIFSFVRVYGDEKIDSLMNELRVNEININNIVVMLSDSGGIEDITIENPHM